MKVINNRRILQGAVQKPVETYEPTNIYGQHIVSTDGDLWKKYRKISHPAFSEVSTVMFQLSTQALEKQSTSAGSKHCRSWMIWWRMCGTIKMQLLVPWCRYNLAGSRSMTELFTSFLTDMDDPEACIARHRCCRWVYSNPFLWI